MRSFFAIATVLLLGARLFHASPQTTWEVLSPMPEGRSGMIAFCLNKSEPAFYGGSSWEGGEKRVHASGYVLRANQWRSLSPLQTPIAYAAVAAAPDSLYAAGGANGIQLNPVLITQKPNLRRQFLKLPPPQTRIYAGAVYLNGAYYQIGGSTRLSPLAPTNSISKFEGNTWSDVGPLPEGPLINSAVAVWKSRVFVFGGGLPRQNGLENTDSVFALKPSKGSWERQVTLPVAVRGSVATSLPDVGILLVGGYTNSNHATPQVLLYNPDKKAFRSLTSLPLGLMLPAVVLTDQSIYVFGGEDAPKHRSASVFRADIFDLLEYSRVQP